MRVTNLTSPRTGAKVANQFVIESDGVDVFQSYNSTIAKYSNVNGDILLEVGEDWDYSRTTMRYFKQFLSEYGWGDEEWKQLTTNLKSGEKGFYVRVNLVRVLVEQGFRK